MQLLIALLSFRGTLSRGEYWAWTVMVWLLFCILRTSFGMWLEPSIGHAATLAIDALALWTLIALSIRRLHDRARSGVWLLMILVPVIGAVWLFVQLALAGSGRYSHFAMRSKPAFRSRASYRPR